jgi:hypothetical protein
VRDFGSLPKSRWTRPPPSFRILIEPLVHERSFAVNPLNGQNQPSPMSSVVIPASSHLCFPNLMPLSKLDLGRASSSSSSSWTQASKPTLPPYRDSFRNQETYRLDPRNETQSLGPADTMSTAYHVSHPHPRALYEPLGGYSQHSSMRARPVLPDPYDTRAVAPEPASIRYTASHSHQQLQQLPQLHQPVIRPTVTIPAPSVGASAAASTSYQPFHSRTSQTVSPSRSFTSQTEKEAPKSTAEMLTQSSTYVPACINPNGGTMADLAADVCFPPSRCWLAEKKIGLTRCR